MNTTLDAKQIMQIRVDCPETVIVGDNDFGYLRAIQIGGGSFSGSLSGRVVPGGADWNTTFGQNELPQRTSCLVFAKYLLQTDDGVFIGVENLGYRNKNGAEPYIKTTPRFHAPRGKYQWLNYGVYVGSLAPGELNGVFGVNLNIYQLL